jgi:hypothetical protein
MGKGGEFDTDSQGSQSSEERPRRERTRKDKPRRKSRYGKLKKLYHSFVETDKGEKTEEILAHGTKGLSVKYYHKLGDKQERIAYFQKDENTYIVRKDDKREEISKDKAIKEILSNKKLEFARDYVKNHVK